MTAVIPTQDRLIAKEVALGVIRERTYPETHIGLASIAPWLEVQSDDAIFQYIQDGGSGLAPARAEDAEAEQMYAEETFGEGRAALVDWSLKNHYSASDVSRYRQGAYIAGQVPGLNMSLVTGSIVEGFAAKVARDDAERQKRLYNRIEWLIQKAVWTNANTTNGKVKYNVEYNRPADQASAVNTLWSSADSDPIADINTLNDTMWNRYGLRLRRAITSEKVMRNLVNSSKFAARSGLAGSSGPSSAKIDPYYLIDGWDWRAAAAIIEGATGVRFDAPYDAVIRTRSRGSKTTSITRFSPENKILFLPDEATISEVASDEIGFGKTLTSPHVEGNWTPGFYEWEKTFDHDPWGTDRGTGVKAFPVFPHMDLSWVLTVLS